MDVRSGAVENYKLAEDLDIVRIMNGMWQVAGGHGYIQSEQAIHDMIAYHDAGFTSWDLADIYGPAEDLIGEFRSRLESLRGLEELSKVRAFTKWVPEPRAISRSMAKSAVERSMMRMKVDSIDLLQFHWWDYNNPYYIDAARFLSELRDEGKIRHIGLTNFDTERMEILEKDANLVFVSNQVQYSIIDRRPEKVMTKHCTDRGNRISLLAYGTLCGGLLSERYLNKQEPKMAELSTASLKKYKKMIDTWGGWELFQELLSVLDSIAKQHHVSIANVAVRYILDKPAVAGAIVGARLGLSEHRSDNAKAFSTRLTHDDKSSIESICQRSNDLYETIGDCGSEYR